MIEKEGSDRVGGKGRNKGIERVRSDSLGAIEELWKKKREELEKSQEEEGIFRKSRKIPGKGSGRRGEKNGRFDKGDKKRIRKDDDESESFRMQEKMWREEMEEMRREFREQGRVWREEKRELMKSIEKMRERVKS